MKMPDFPEIYDPMDDLLIRYCQEECTMEERLRVELWSRESPQNSQRLRQWQWLCQQRVAAGREHMVDVDAAWQQFLVARSAAASNKTSGKAKPFRPWPWLAAAAVLTALLIAVRWLIPEPAPTAQPLVWHAADKVLKDTLPDGSLVTLNRRSKLYYPSSFTDSVRMVTLEGEGFFDIVPDAAQPFIIQAGDVRIRVLGTRFHVQQRNKAVQVAVESGRVQVFRQASTVVLTAGQQVKANSETTGLVAEGASPGLYNYYSTGSFICDNTRVAELAEVLSEAFGTPIQPANQAIGDLRITTTIAQMPLDAVLDLITQTLGIQWHRRGTVIYLE